MTNQSGMDRKGESASGRTYIMICSEKRARRATLALGGTVTGQRTGPPISSSPELFLLMIRAHSLVITASVEGSLDQCRMVSNSSRI